MRILKDRDYKTFTQLCALTQNGMIATMKRYLESKYDTVVATDDYIYAVGNIPVALAAHMDTVFPRPATQVYYDKEQNVIWSPDGLGADDRAGIFAIIQIIKKGLRPHIILTTDEEKGANGAFALAELKCPFPDLRFIIQLDRRGADDCVFYECENNDFIDYIESFGFVEAIGSFTDISVICPEWGIAGVNLSVGYKNEHSVSETLHVGHLLNTIDKVTNILSQPEKKLPRFIYVASKRRGWWNRWNTWKPTKPTAEECKCASCSKQYPSDELIDVKTADFKWKKYCGDCIVDKVDWCACCGEAYELNSDGAAMRLCEDCYYDFYYTASAT